MRSFSKKMKNDLAGIQKNFYIMIRIFGKGVFKPPPKLVQKKEGINYGQKEKNHS